MREVPSKFSPRNDVCRRDSPSDTEDGNVAEVGCSRREEGTGNAVADVPKDPELHSVETVVPLRSINRVAAAAAVAGAAAAPPLTEVLW